MTSFNLLANPPPNTYIIHEDSIPLISPLRVKSNIPVTIQRYTFFPGGDTTKVVVSSDCDSDHTTFIPSVKINEEGVDIEAQSTSGWLESAWFQAVWSRDESQRNLQAVTTAPNAISTLDETTVDTATVDNYCGTNWYDAYMTCRLPCPTGDDDCLILGMEYTCQQFTTCKARIESGVFDELDASSTSSTVDSMDIGGSTAATGSSIGSETTTFSLESGSTEGTVIATLPAFETTVPGENTTIAPTSTFGITNTASTTVGGSQLGTTTESTSTSTTTDMLDPTTEISSISTIIESDTPTEASTNSTSGPVETSSTETTSEDTYQPTPPPNYYNYNNPSVSPLVLQPSSSTNYPSYTPTTYYPTYLPTSNARGGYGLLVTLLAAMTIMLVFDVEGKITVTKIAMFASLTSIMLSSLRTGSTTTNSANKSVDDSHVCRYHIDVVASTCQAVHIDAPSVRVMSISIGNVTSVSNEGGIREYSATFVPELEEFVMKGGTTLDAMC